MCFTTVQIPWKHKCVLQCSSENKFLASLAPQTQFSLSSSRVSAHDGDDDDDAVDAVDDDDDDIDVYRAALGMGDPSGNKLHCLRKQIFSHRLTDNKSYRHR